jgi:hypothetical protein
MEGSYDHDIDNDNYNNNNKMEEIIIVQIYNGT